MQFTSKVSGAVLLVAALGLGAGLSACGSSGSADATTTTTSNFGVLTPAKVKSVITECSELLDVLRGGNAGPLQCGTGGLNINAWNFYTATGRGVMSLGRVVTADQVKQAMCKDTGGAIVKWPLELNAATIASLYYGWNLSTAIKHFDPATC
jgi:hypothetical protein